MAVTSALVSSLNKISLLSTRIRASQAFSGAPYVIVSMNAVSRNAVSRLVVSDRDACIAQSSIVPFALAAMADSVSSRTFLARVCAFTTLSAGF